MGKRFEVIDHTADVGIAAYGEDLKEAFANAASFKQSLGDWNISNISNLEGVLDNTALTTVAYDHTLISWAAQGELPQNISLGATSLQFCLAAEARESLANQYNWEFTGDQQACQNPFVTTWQVPSSSNSIEIPTNPDYNYSYSVDWGDGIISSNAHLLSQVD